MVQVRIARDCFIARSLADIVSVYDTPALVDGLKGSPTSRKSLCFCDFLSTGYELFLEDQCYPLIQSSPPASRLTRSQIVPDSN
jgi:hypothetical protein